MPKRNQVVLYTEFVKYLKKKPYKTPRRPSSTFLKVVCLLASFGELSNHIFYFVFPCPRKLITLLQPVNAGNLLCAKNQLSLSQL